MAYEESLPGRSTPDLLQVLESDLSLIRRDIVAVMQETANVRASMTEFSSWRPAVSKRFVVVSGLLCFIAVAVLVVYQSQVQEWVQRIADQVFRSHS